MLIALTARQPSGIDRSAARRRWRPTWDGLAAALPGPAVAQGEDRLVVLLGEPAPGLDAEAGLHQPLDLAAQDEVDGVLGPRHRRRRAARQLVRDLAHLGVELVAGN